MANQKINYGIDLGTTNSAICRMEKGVPTIKKVEVTDDTMPSCVFFNKKKTANVGKSAYNSMKSDKRKATKSLKEEASNTYVEFKRAMGTDQKYISRNMDGRAYSSEELSSMVLKQLLSFIKDDQVTSAVITVPAKFTVNQKTATIEAARLAGIEHCELLQEPIAAAMAYGLKADDKNGYWLVFDFGGGTFDAALIKVEEGIIQVFDTEGDNYLGGKNLDYAIVDDIMMTWLEENYSVEQLLEDPVKKRIWREALKTYAEDIKNKLSFEDSADVLTDVDELGNDDDGEEIELDLTVTREEAEDVMRPLFQRAVDICSELLKRNNLSGKQLDKLILVGGPTHSSLLRSMLAQQITPNIDTSIDPMTAVATGAALYASTIDADAAAAKPVAEEVELDITYDSMTVQTDIFVPVSIKNGPQKVTVVFTRADNAYDSGRVEIDKQGDVIELQLMEGRPNSFSVECYDERGRRLSCFPDEITIIQGTHVGNATLPYDISIGVYTEDRERTVVHSVKGLERNHPMPVTGTANNLFTYSLLRAGVNTDKLFIPIYQAPHDGDGKPVYIFDHVGDVIIDGDDIDKNIEKDSRIDITITVDRNEQMTVEAYFPQQDITVEKKLDTSKKQSVEEARDYVDTYLSQAYETLQTLRQNGIETAEVEEILDDVEAQDANDDQIMQIKKRLRDALMKLEDLENGSEWQRLEQELRKSFERTEKADEREGNADTHRELEKLRRQVDDVIRAQDIKLGYALVDEINRLYWRLTAVYQFIFIIKDLNEDFGTIQWSDSRRARNLIDRGLREINNTPTADDLRPIVQQLFALIPDIEKRRRERESGIRL